MTGSGTAAPETAGGASLARTHLVGIGGAGMSAIARILADRGLAVSGSDAKGSPAVTGLISRGVPVAVGHDAANLDLLADGPTTVVVSTAIRPDNVELVAARARGIPVVRRAEALAALMVGRRSICIAGTHGKTSTTSMLTVALQQAGLDPSFAIGGELNEAGSGAHHGSGDVFVAEADESDGSFLSFAPHGAVITNIEPDHLDHHGTAEAYHAVFDQFVDRIAPGGFLVACVDDPGVRDLLSRIGTRPYGPGPARVVRYGSTPDADVLIDYSPPISRIRLADGTEIALTLSVPGAHMVANATGALAAGVELGVDPVAMADGLAAFSGVRRRFEFKGRSAGVTVYDDYAHHPTEVRAQLRAARDVLTDGRLVVVFQPHLYSRTRIFADDFAAALAGADVVMVLEIYGSREDPEPGVTGRAITDRMAQLPTGPELVLFEPSLASAPETVLALLRPGDVLVTMGAGDVTSLGPVILQGLDDLGRDELGESP